MMKNYSKNRNVDNASVASLSGDARGIRTPDRRLRRPLLYPAELLHQIVGIDYYNLINAVCKGLIRLKL